jgi:hypothetical protein
MKTALLALLLLIHFVPAQANTLCNLGHQAEFGSDAQLSKLQELIQSDLDAKFIAIVWRVDGTAKSVIESLLLYDRPAKTLWRSKVIRAGAEKLPANWLSWHDISDAQILALKPAEGFDLPKMQSGKGPIDVSKEAAEFLRKELPTKKK